MNRQIELIIVGAGSRGSGYASFAEQHPGRLRITGVAEPRSEHRNRIAERHHIPDSRRFTDWRQLAEEPRLADGVVIATQDGMHRDPAIAFARKGYHLLLEKPMAPTESDSIDIVREVRDAGVLFAVCHVMRYTDYTRRLKDLIDSGSIGTIASIEHLEPVGYWHQAHSFVRGNWRNEHESSSMLLAKSCHDLDWLRYIIGQKCEAVSSFGSLLHFKRDQKPREAGTAIRCVNCVYDSKCPYSAKKIYLDRVAKGELGWPVDVLTPRVTEMDVRKALESGPYGRCVYECDNNVVDHQVVNMEFAGGVTASFTMTAFTESSHRKTRVFGTRGMIEGDGRILRRFDFLNDDWEEFDTQSSDGTVTGGHGGGDYHLMDSFVTAVASGDGGTILSGPDESLETHRMVFAAEQGRRARTVVAL